MDTQRSSLQTSQDSAEGQWAGKWNEIEHQRFLEGTTTPTQHIKGIPTNGNSYLILSRPEPSPKSAAMHRNTSINWAMTRRRLASRNFNYGGRMILPSPDQDPKDLKIVLKHPLPPPKNPKKLLNLRGARGKAKMWKKLQKKGRRKSVIKMWSFLSRKWIKSLNKTTRGQLWMSKARKRNILRRKKRQNLLLRPRTLSICLSRRKQLGN